MAGIPGEWFPKFCFVADSLFCRIYDREMLQQKPSAMLILHNMNDSFLRIPSNLMIIKVRALFPGCCYQPEVGLLFSKKQGQHSRPGLLTSQDSVGHSQWFQKGKSVPAHLQLVMGVSSFLDNGWTCFYVGVILGSG